MLLAHSSLIVLLFLPSSALPLQNPPQTPPQPTAPKKPEVQRPTVDPSIELPVDLDRIQRALAKTPMLRFDDAEPSGVPRAGVRRQADD